MIVNAERASRAASVMRTNVLKNSVTASRSTGSPEAIGSRPRRRSAFAARLARSWKRSTDTPIISRSCEKSFISTQLRLALNSSTASDEKLRNSWFSAWNQAVGRRS